MILSFRRYFSTALTPNLWGMLLYRAETSSVAHLYVGNHVVSLRSTIRVAESLRYDSRLVTYFWRKTSIYFDKGLVRKLMLEMIGLPDGFSGFLWILGRW